MSVPPSSLPTLRVEVPGEDHHRNLVACQQACPVHTDARGYVRAIAEGRFEEAYLIARGPNPFASICGRTCGAPCETACRRGKIPRVDDDGAFVGNDRPVAIRALKRFACELHGVEAAPPAEVEDLRNYAGTAWYQRDFDVPKDFAEKRFALGFHGVAHLARVYVNGRFAGEHAGAQAPFLLDISQFVAAGKKNMVTVRVYNPPSGVSYYLDTNSLLKVSGIWRSVWMEATGKVFISDLFMIPEIEKSQAIAKAAIYTGSPADAKLARQLTVIATDPNGRKFEVTAALDPDSASASQFRNAQRLC